MSATATLPRSRRRVRARRSINWSFVFLWWLILPVEAATAILRWLNSLPMAAGDTRPHYSGAFGDTVQDMQPYDRMSEAEHDEAGALWHY